MEALGSHLDSYPRYPYLGSSMFSPVPIGKYRYSNGVPRNFVRGGEVQQSQLRTEDRENGDLGAVAPYPLVKCSGGSCNLVQETSFHIVKVS